MVTSGSMKASALLELAADLQVHPSHRPDFYRGLLWCRNCGCHTSGKKTFKLRLSCSPAKSPQLAVHLKRLQSRLLPSNLPSWPDDKQAAEMNGMNPMPA